MDAWYFNPILIQIGPVAVRWYGVMYAISFFLGYLWLHYSASGKDLKLNNEQKDVLLMSSILGVLLGGRIGYIIFYNLSYYLANPLKIFYVWEGGMSFHGGLIGVGIALLWFSKKHKTAFLKISDVITGIAPIGLLLVRIGNFINGELYGKIATRFCLYFPTDPKNCRYPSQLLESFLEGFVLFILLIIVRKFSHKTGVNSGFFLIFYGILRTIVEFFREPDVQIGYLWGGITQGQLLSLFMIAAGVVLLFFIARKKDPESSSSKVIS